MPPRAPRRKEPAPPTVTYKGKTYRCQEPGIWPLMQFARAASDGMTVIDMHAMAAIHRFLEGCLDPADWSRFEQDMIESRIASIDDLLDFAADLVVVLQVRLAEKQSAAATNGKATV